MFMFTCLTWLASVMHLCRCPIGLGLPSGCRKGLSGSVSVDALGVYIRARLVICALS